MPISTRIINIYMSSIRPVEEYLFQKGFKTKDEIRDYAYRNLDPRRYKIIRMRLGLPTDSQIIKQGYYSFDEIAEEFGITKTRIHQIFTRAIQKLVIIKKSEEE